MMLQGRGDGLAMDTSGLIDNWDDAEGYYCKFCLQTHGRFEIPVITGKLVDV